MRVTNDALGTSNEETCNLPVPSIKKSDTVNVLDVFKYDGSYGKLNERLCANYYDNCLFVPQPLKDWPQYTQDIMSLEDKMEVYKTEDGNNQSYCNGNAQYNASNDLIAFNPDYGSTATSRNSEGVSNMWQGTIGRNVPSSSGKISNTSAIEWQSLDKAVRLSDLVKLTEAIHELVRRLPMPPTQELLRSVEPNLALTLQLTYLKAYIQNQQLLQDLKSGLVCGVFSGVEIPKYNTKNPAICASFPANPANGETAVYENLNPMTQSIGIVDSIASTTGPTFIMNNSNDYIPFQSEAQGVLEPFKGVMNDRSQLYQPDLYCVSGSISQLPQALPLAVPPELKNTVKYDGHKHSFVAVSLGPLGARKRKAFSIRKFGVDRALKLAAKFAVGNSGTRVAKKERGLLEDVCETALNLNPKSGQCLENIERARNMPETRGLVFSCGAQLWLTVTYDSTGKRHIKGFPVSELGFEGAYKAAVSELNSPLHGEGCARSKLSGALYFWLEEKDGTKTLCLLVTSKDLAKHGVDDQKVYVGRFEIGPNDGFNSTRKIAQKWRSEMKNKAT